MKTISDNGSTTSIHVWAGGCTVLAKGVGESHGFGIEFLASFLVVFVVFACYEKTKYEQHSQAAPFVIGLIYAAAITVTVRNGTAKKSARPGPARPTGDSNC